MIQEPHGIVLVTGPTGSGKTTTLYSSLKQLATDDVNVCTIEDPIEMVDGSFNQMQVQPTIDLTFADGVRALLRQDPDIIMIGEIRDLETAAIATNASLTGHLVFSTLHTNDAPSAIARLIDIGVQPFLVATSIRAIMAQRLVRRLCSKCKEPGHLSETELRGLHIEASQLGEANIMRPVGCDLCRQTGYKGRMGIFELFEIDDEVRHMVNNRTSTIELRQRARELGMRTLREDGVRKVLAGMTSAEEVISITIGDAN
jgi:general secretion pathway protein E/type IV pilus assembly protein PilB